MQINNISIVLGSKQYNIKITHPEGGLTGAEYNCLDRISRTCLNPLHTEYIDTIVKINGGHLTPADIIRIFNVVVEKNYKEN